MEKRGLAIMWASFLFVQAGFWLQGILHLTEIIKSRILDTHQ